MPLATAHVDGLGEKVTCACVQCAQQVGATRTGDVVRDRGRGLDVSASEGVLRAHGEHAARQRDAEREAHLPRGADGTARHTAALAALPLPVEFSDGVAIPTPRPTTKKPGRSASHDAHARTSTKPSRSPRPMSRIPLPITRSGRSRCMTRRSEADTTNEAPDIGRATRPAVTGDRPSTDCIQIEELVSDTPIAGT